jgi:hypothetical protein
MQNCGMFESLHPNFSLSFDKEVYMNYITSCKIHYYYYYYYHHQQQQHQQQQLSAQMNVKSLALGRKQFPLVLSHYMCCCKHYTNTSLCKASFTLQAGLGWAKPSRIEPNRFGMENKPTL